MKIKILDLIFDIIEIDDNAILGNFGSTNFALGQIKINKEANESQKKNTLMHEMFHIIINDLRLPIDRDKEEVIVSGLTSGLLTCENIKFEYPID